MYMWYSLYMDESNQPKPEVQISTKLLRPLYVRLKSYCAGSGKTMQDVVVQALKEFLARVEQVQ